MVEEIYGSCVTDPQPRGRTPMLAEPAGGCADEYLTERTRVPTRRRLPQVTGPRLPGRPARGRGLRRRPRTERTPADGPNGRHDSRHLHPHRHRTDPDRRQRLHSHIPASAGTLIDEVTGRCPLTRSSPGCSRAMAAPQPVVPRCHQPKRSGVGERVPEPRLTLARSPRRVTVRPRSLRRVSRPDVTPHFHPGTDPACSIHVWISGSCASSKVVTLT